MVKKVGCYAMCYRLQKKCACLFSITWCLTMDTKALAEWMLFLRRFVEKGLELLAQIESMFLCRYDALIEK